MTTRGPSLLILSALGALLALGAGAAVALGMEAAGAERVLPAVAALVLAVVLVLKPWTAVPVVIVGGAAADKLLGLDEVAEVAAVRIGLIALVVVALAVRRASEDDWGPRVRTAADPIAIALIGICIVGAGYGLAAGHTQHDIWVAGYLVSVIPAYFFLTTFTLNTPGRLLAGVRLFTWGAVVMAAIAYTGEGRQGGLLSTIALAGALALATRNGADTPERILYGALAFLFATDVMLSGFRTVWIATLIGVGLMVIWMGPARGRVIAGMVALIAAGLLIVPAVGGPVEERFETAAAQFAEPPGYREAETGAGLEILAESPVVGHGLGKVERGQYLETLGYADVGPSFHAFYLTVGVAVGLIGLLALAALLGFGISAARRVPLDSRFGALAIGFATLAGGWAVAAGFAGPTDGHWELGLLTGLALVSASHARRGRDPDAANPHQI